MSVSVYDRTVFSKLAAVEGDRWVREQMKLLQDATAADQPMPENSFVGALVTFAEAGNAVIYGDGGWNRYVIHHDGEIVFSKFHCPSDERARLATEVGFRVG